jgi:hypothetical protein
MTIQQRKQSSREVSKRLDELRAQGVWGDSLAFRQYAIEVLLSATAASQERTAVRETETR